MTVVQSWKKTPVRKHDENRASVDVRSKGAEEETGECENVSAWKRVEALHPQGSMEELRCITSPVLFF
jgi:hypothetical protein